MSSAYLGFYYPNNKETGAAFQFSLWQTKRGYPAIRVEAANQNGPKPQAGSSATCFDWQNKGALQIDAGECGKLGAYIRGFNRLEKNNAPVMSSLFHTSKDKEGNSVQSKFVLKAPNKGDERNPNQNWLLSLEVKRGSEQFRASAYIHAGEIYQLLWLFDITITNEMRFAASERDRKANSNGTQS